MVKYIVFVYSYFFRDCKATVENSTALPSKERNCSRAMLCTSKRKLNVALGTVCRKLIFQTVTLGELFKDIVLSISITTVTRNEKQKSIVFVFKNIKPKIEYSNLLLI